MGEKKRREKAARTGPLDPSTIEGLVLFSPEAEPPWLEKNADARHFKIVSLDLLHSQQATCILCDEVLDRPAVVGIIVANKGHSLGAFGACGECFVDAKSAGVRIGNWLADTFGPGVALSPMAMRWFQKHAN
jgi:hypothetical protein